MPRWLLPLLALPLLAQTPTFEVASIRPSQGALKDGSFCRILKPGMETATATGITLNLLIIDAYEADRFDLPDWGRDRFDVSARLPPNTTVDICREMLRNLLAERFHLVVSIDTKIMPTYFLKVAKSGLKLKSVPGPPPDVRASLKLVPGAGHSKWAYQAAPMARVFTSVEAAVVTGGRIGDLEADRVVDETGLTGYYDGELQYQHPSEIKGDAAPRAPNLKDALETQLGLTLELRKAPRTVLTIVSSDHKPSEN